MKLSLAPAALAELQDAADFYVTHGGASLAQPPSARLLEETQLADGRRWIDGGVVVGGARQGLG